jgi:GMC oxidoreductase/FAD dependent oxidoreductase
MKPNGGSMALFAVAPDGTLGRMWQPAPAVGWSGWEELGVRVQSAPVAFENTDGRIEVVAAGAGGRLGHIRQLSPGDLKAWSEWEHLGIGPEIQRDPAVFPNADGRLEVFAIGPDGCLGHSWQEEPGGSTWSEWGSFGHRILSTPAVFRNSYDFLEVFAIGPDGCVGHVWQRRSMEGWTEWSDWGSFGYELQSPPSVCRQADGRLEVFAIGPDGCLGHIWQQEDPGGSTTSWSTWGSFGHQIHSPPAALRNSDGHLEVFAIGADGCLGHIWQHVDPGGMVIWSDWGSFGHAIQGPPTLCMDADGRLEVFAVGPSGRLGHLQQWEPGEPSWSDWEDVGPPISERPVAICPSGALVGVELSPPTTLRPQASPNSKPSTRSRLTADVCVIGAGPAGITVAEGLVRAGANVVLLESGGWNEDPEAQTLNHGDAEGPIIKGDLRYLRRGRVRQVQGSASIWGLGWCMPFRSIDFTRRGWVPLSGWPVRAAELAPYQRRAAATFGFDPFEAPARDGALTRLSYHYPRNPLLFRAMLVELLAAPEFRVELGTTAVELNLKSDRVQSVRCARLAGGELRVKADKVVLAGGGIENARMLLFHERSLPANSSMTGRCFMEHPHVRAGTVRLRDSTPLYSLFYGFGGQSSLDVLALPDATQRRERILNTMVQLRPIASVVRANGPVECDVYLRTEQAPNPDSRIVLGERLDRFGWPRPKLRWELLDLDWTSVVRTAELVSADLEQRHGARVELSIGSDSPWPMEPADPLESGDAAWGNHHMGTTRMAADPAEGVVDRDCLVHGTANLYVAGSSVFPTGGCANPTFMIVTLAHRLVDHLTNGR